MFKSALAPLLAWTMAACSTSQMRVVAPEKLGFLNDASITIVAKNHEGEFAPSCSGVWVSADVALTAYHCIDDAGLSEEQKVLYDIIGLEYNPLGGAVNFVTWRSMADKEEIDSADEAIVIAIDKGQDLALIKTTSTSMHSVSYLADNEPIAGDMIHIVGATAGLTWSYSPGVVSSVRTMENMRGERSRLLQIVSGAWRGNSGGGAFNADGELVGVCSFLAAGTMMSFFISQEPIRAFLKDNDL